MKDCFKMNRRSFLQGAGAVGAATLMGAPTILRAAPLKLMFGHEQPPGNPRSLAADKFAELVRIILHKPGIKSGKEIMQLMA